MVFRILNEGWADGSYTITIGLVQMPIWIKDSNCCFQLFGGLSDGCMIGTVINLQSVAPEFITEYDTTSLALYYFA